MFPTMLDNLPLGANVAVRPKYFLAVFTRNLLSIFHLPSTAERGTLTLLFTIFLREKLLAVNVFHSSFLKIFLGSSLLEDRAFIKARRSFDYFCGCGFHGVPGSVCASLSDSDNHSTSLRLISSSVRKSLFFPSQVFYKLESRTIATNLR